ATVLKIDIVHDPEESPRSIAVLKPWQAECGRRVDGHPEKTQHKTNQHGPKRSLRIETLPEHPEEEHHEDRRREIALHRLQVVVQTLRVFDDRNPGQGDDHHDGCGDAADTYKLVLGCARLPLLVKVHSK